VGKEVKVKVEVKVEVKVPPSLKLRWTKEVEW
jgi:hypothetical protein